MARYGMDRFILAPEKLSTFRFLSNLNPWNWLNRRRGLTRGECLRLALEELGPIFVKFGQILSTRADLLPDDIAAELAKLQDKVPPFPGEIAIKMAAGEYNQPLDQIFSEFNLVPLASASIAQVHAAKLLDGQEVVVKILRPKIRKIIDRDISLMYSVARLIEKIFAEGQRLRLTEVVAEFHHTIIDELDLLREASNASQLRRNFANSQLIYVPEVFWAYTKTNIAVFERIYGIPISNVELLRQQGFDLKVLAERGVEIFFTQVFRDSFFHADMHPGNIFVAKRDPKNPQYIGVDFGIMGSLSPNDQRYLAENLLAFFNRDYRRIAVLHVDSGWVPPDTRVEEFEGTIRAVCEPIFERPLKDISFGQLLLRLFQTARRYNMQVQPQLMLLQKTLLNVEGLGRQLYPDLDLWDTGKPYIERWIKQRTGPQALITVVKEKGPFWWEKLGEMPDLIYDTFKKRQFEHIEKSVLEIHSQVKRSTKTSKNFAIGVGIALIIVVALHLIVSNYFPEQLLFLDFILLIAGLVSLLSAWVIRR